jgi:glycosyltransferase involved in cell wall biosynthesis
MHIAINAQLLSSAQSYRGAGVSNYSRHLLEHLGLCVQHGGTSHRFTAFVNAHKFQPAGINICTTTAALANPLARIPWEQVVFPFQLRQIGIDLVHGLVNVLPLATNTPGVVTVHDLSFIRTPDKLPAAKRWYLASLCKASVKRASHIIAVSRQTADDLICFFNTPADKITVIHNGVAAAFTPASSEHSAQFRRQRGLPERYLFYLGTLEPRKNLSTLLQVYARWLAERPQEHAQVKLILAGAKGWFYDDIFRQAQSLRLESQVLFPGYIPETELPDWYRAAEAFVYPSLFEGFGLPLIEAMACATPVLCSQASSLLEVAGDSALTFSPDSKDDLLAKLRRLLADTDLQEELRRKGLLRAREYSWQRTAMATLSVYDAVA